MSCDMPSARYILADAIYDCVVRYTANAVRDALTGAGSRSFNGFLGLKHQSGLRVRKKGRHGGFQHLCRPLSILQLRALIAAGDGDPGGDMGHADGGLHLIDVLSALPPIEEDIGADVLIRHLGEGKDGIDRKAHSVAERPLGQGGQDVIRPLPHHFGAEGVFGALLEDGGELDALGHGKEHFLRRAYIINE